MRGVAEQRDRPRSSAAADHGRSTGIRRTPASPRSGWTNGRDGRRSAITLACRAATSLAAAAAGIDADVERFTANVDVQPDLGDAGVLRIPCCDRDPLPHWTWGRVTLLGDARIRCIRSDRTARRRRSSTPVRSPMTGES